MIMNNKKRSYSELNKLNSFDDKYLYLKMDGTPGDITFGGLRYLNQSFYKSTEWKSVRRKVILRDGNCDLGDINHPIHGKTIVHHINPISIKDLENGDPKIFDMDNLICVSEDTHNAIHYGDEDYLNKFKMTVRSPNDTIPWK